MLDRRSLVLGLGAGLATAGCVPPPPVPERTPYLATPGASPAGPAPRAGLLLPFSGPEAALGRALLDAARQALAEVEPGSLVLVPQDTVPDPAGAARRAGELGCGLLIGPVTGVEARAAAAGTTAPVLTLSNDASVGRQGLWPLGLDPEAQAARVAAFAASIGRARFAAVVPEDGYGARLLRGLSAALALRPGAALVATVTHTSVGLPPLDLAARLEGADAVLVGAGGRVPTTVMALLGTNDPALTGSTPPRLLGTLRWLHEPEPTGALPPPGAWIAVPDPAAANGFAARYARAFGRPAHPLALLVADAVGVAASTAARAPGGFPTSTLTRPEGFTGLLGSFRLGSEGRVERLLTVAETRAGGSGGLDIVDPAPATFGGPAGA